MNSECNRPGPLATGDPLLTFGTEKVAWQKFCLEALQPKKTNMFPEKGPVQ